MLTTKQAAEELGVSPRRVTSLIESGALTAQKFGRSWMVDEASVRQRAQTEHRAGRPCAQEAASTGRFILMNRNHPVASFAYRFTDGAVTHLEPLDDVAWKPFGIGRLDKAPNRYDFAEWIRNRAIPGVRPNLPLILRDLKVRSAAALMFESWGLSLSDPYWFKPQTTDVDWEDVNYFANGYENGFGSLMLSENATLSGNLVLSGRPVLSGKLPAETEGAKSAATSDAATPTEPRAASSGDKIGTLRSIPAITRTPDTATNGMLNKAWLRIGGKDYLLKGGTGNENREPFNEVLATKLLGRLLAPEEFVPYEVVERGGRAYSSCPNMVSAETELIPAQDVLTAFAVSEGRDLHQGYLAALEQLRVPQFRQLIDKMIVADHLMANFDRHTHNFGLIRSAETLDGYRVAPLFDHGCGFYCRATTAELEAGPYRWESHPFREYPSQQLALVQDLSWYDPSALEGFSDEIAEVLGQNPEIDHRFIEAVQKQTQRQIDTVNSLAAERGLIVPGW